MCVWIFIIIIIIGFQIETERGGLRFELMTFWWDSTDVIYGADQIKVFSASQILDRLLMRSPPYFLAFVGRAVGNMITRGPLAAHPPSSTVPILPVDK